MYVWNNAEFWHWDLVSWILWQHVMRLLQVVLLSATMPAEVLDVTKKFMRDPIRILVKKEELTLEGIKQFYINVEREVGLLVRNTTQHPSL